MKIILVHGWGADAQYWDALARHLPAGETRRVDLGFTGRPLVDAPQDPALYITHSLGTMWALKNRLPSMMGLIALNGFPCFNAFTNPRVMKAMQAGLNKNPARQMAQFYDMADMPPQRDLDAPRLGEGLQWLADWDMRDALQSLQSLSRPVTALLGGADRIVPLDAAQELWGGADVRICTQGGHNLPQTHTEWCARHIEKHMNEHIKDMIERM